jgi:hypothetical protein
VVLFAFCLLTFAFSFFESAIGDGDAAGVARQVAERGLRPTERLLGLDQPLGLAQRCEKGGECSGVDEAAVITEELQASSLVGCAELAQEQSPEQARGWRASI